METSDAMEEGPVDNAQVVTFMLNALSAKEKGNSANYLSIVQQIVVRNDLDMVWRVYHGLSKCVAHFTPHPDKYKDLIQAIFSYDWRGPGKISCAFIHLQHSIVSANATFLGSVFESFVKALQIQLPDKAVDPSGELFAISIYPRAYLI